MFDAFWQAFLAFLYFLGGFGRESTDNKKHKTYICFFHMCMFKTIFNFSDGREQKVGQRAAFFSSFCLVHLVVK